MIPAPGILYIFVYFFEKNHFFMTSKSKLSAFVKGDPFV